MPKKLSNGDLLYGHNEDHPVDIFGYTRDNNNHDLYHLDYLTCVFRSSRTKKLPCGKIREYEFCTLKQILVTRKSCEDCKERKDHNQI